MAFLVESSFGKAEAGQKEAHPVGEEGQLDPLWNQVTHVDDL